METKNVNRESQTKVIRLCHKQECNLLALKADMVFEKCAGFQIPTAMNSIPGPIFSFAIAQRDLLNFHARNLRLNELVKYFNIRSKEPGSQCKEKSQFPSCLTISGSTYVTLMALVLHSILLCFELHYDNNVDGAIKHLGSENVLNWKQRNI